MTPATPAGTSLRVALLYPELLGTYGDGGNAQVLRQRCRWRGIDCEVTTVAIGDPVPATADIYLLGGGEDAAQTAAVAELAAARGLQAAADQGAVIFGVCAGYQLLGEWFLDGEGRQTDGLGVLDARTARLDTRAVGEIVAEPVGLPGLPVLTGFENHGGRTTLGAAARPLAAVRTGVGNGDRGAEGAVQGRVIATYLHGPALARNPALADYLIGLVVGELAPLDDGLVERLRAERLGAHRRRPPRRFGLGSQP